MGILVPVGQLLMAVGGIWLIVLAFQRSVGWGLGVLLLPFVGWIFAAKNWSEAKKPFLIQLLGVVLAVVGGIAAAGSVMATPQ